MELRFGGILALTLALALAGCADNDDGDPDPTGTTTGTSTGTMTGTSTGGPQPPVAGAAVYVNGTVSGVADCALLGVDAPPAQGSTQSVPVGMANGTYALTVSEGQGTETACIVFDDGTTGNSGTTPMAAEFTVYVDGAPAGVAYSVLFTPPQ